ncbi:CAP domain-containing protein [Halomarina halobia]|uniref:CAP domain-containing protein n=1 Tax=Halomarina halobia TaxID=3033386 RepID=A0ABD6A6M6_9EURY|nr:CAP domain-containing protein [Halomarina sp. PSR21]
MGNRVLLVVIGGLVLASMAVGGLLGMQLSDGSAATDASSDGSANDTDGANGTGGADGTDGTDAGGAEGADEPEFSAEEVDAAAIEREIVAVVNAEVRADVAGEDPTLARGEALDEMAQFHSDNMAAQGYPSHAAAGYDTLGRYERFDLYGQCRVPDDTRSGVREGRELETISRVELDATDVPDERAIARTVVTRWTDDPDARTKLTYRYADRVGVGVTVTDGGHVYATLDLC